MRKVFAMLLALTAALLFWLVARIDTEEEESDFGAEARNYTVDSEEHSQSLTDGFAEVEASGCSYFDANELDWDYSYVVRVVGAEARGEPFDGIMAVAQCIYDTAERTGMTPEEVVKQKGQYAPPMEDYIFDNCEAVNEACLLVFACSERAVEDNIEFFKTVSCKSAWHDSLRYVTTIGNHQFYALEETK